MHVLGMQNADFEVVLGLPLPRGHFLGRDVRDILLVHKLKMLLPQICACGLRMSSSTSRRESDAVAEVYILLVHTCALTSNACHEYELLYSFTLGAIAIQENNRTPLIRTTDTA